MSEELDEQSWAEIYEVLRLVRAGDFDFVDLRTTFFQLTIAKADFQSDRSAGLEQGAGAAQPSADTSITGPSADTTLDAGGDDGAVLPDDHWDVTAPMVGIFYRAPDPGSPPFVDVGSTVGSDETLGLIEVMKTFTALTSDRPGEVVSIAAANGELVEYGQRLFVLRPIA